MGAGHRGSDETTTLLQSKYDPTEAPDVSFTVTVVEGPDAGASRRVDGSEASRVLVGQSPVCELRLTDREASRRHAALELVGRELRVTDLGSTNGTYLGSVRIGDAFLSGGERLRLGGTTLAVARGDATSATVPFRSAFGRMVGASREMRRLYPLCERLAASNVPVIVEGETGTGKEVLAESLHELGPRSAGPFVVFDCTAVPTTLAESELFGHERGAFTGALATRKGIFEQGEGGTLFIDEIGDLELALQGKLLRAVERGEVRRIGGDRWIRVDVRIICATRRDLDQEVQAGRFRDDLFHRLAVARIELPPLAVRKGDIALLAAQFWRDVGGDDAGLSAELVSRWESRGWPGNVRELRNAVARQFALGELAAAQDPAAQSSSSAEDLFVDVLSQRLPLIQARQIVVEAFEQRYLDQVLAEHGGNVVHAARASGLARRYFQILRNRRRGAAED